MAGTDLGLGLPFGQQHNYGRGDNYGGAPLTSEQKKNYREALQAEMSRKQARVGGE